MTIVVKCPHCETKFNLQPELVGKSMRCPNRQCRQTFMVREQPRAVDPPPALPPEPLPLSEEPEAVPAKATKVKKPEKNRPPATKNKFGGGNGEVVEAEVVEAAVVIPPQVKEVVWSEGTTVPPPKNPRESRESKEKERKPARPTAKKAKPTRPIPVRKKKKNRAPLILIGMLVTIVLFGGGAIVYSWRYQQLSEQQEAEQAEKEYAKGEYATAFTSFSKLATDYPESAEIAKYQFYREICDMERTVRNVSNRENPDAAIKKFMDFIEAQRESGFISPKGGQGGKVLDAGKKLVEDIGGYASDRVKAYQADRANKSSELTLALKAISTGRTVLEKLERFRTADDPPLDKNKEALEQADAEIKHEHDRTTALARAAQQLRTLSDVSIQSSESDLAAAGFLSDSEAQGMIADAKAKLRDMIRYDVADAAGPVQPPASATATMLFVSPIGKTALPSERVGSQTAQPSVFLAVARGILYAIEENTGAMLWAVRVGSEITDPPTIARVDFEDGPLDMALVNFQVGGESALAGFVLRSGQIRWYQKLPAPAAGPALVYGTRAYLPLRDSLGTIYRFDVTTGQREGSIRLAQPVGPAAVMRAGTGLLYVAAESRRIFVVDVALKDDLGSLKPPQCVQIIATGHPTGTLRTPPLLIGPGGDAVGDRWMILSQADGANNMKLRAYKVLPIQTAAADGKPPAEVPANFEAELPLRGWAWFPPVTDGERMAVVSDAGQLRLFEVRQPGNADRPIYPLPEPQPPLPLTADGTAVRGVAFPAEEMSFWALTNGSLQKFRLVLLPSRGLQVVPVGSSMRLGEAMQMPQLNSRGDAMFMVARSQNSDACKAVLLGLSDGAVRWQRQLGIVPATTPIPHNDGLLLVSKDGGMLEVPGGEEAALAPGMVKVAPSAWVIAPPPENVMGSTSVVVSSDGKTVFTITPVQVNEELKVVPKFLVRRVVAGKVVHEGTVNVPSLLTGGPAPLSGNPVLLGNSLLLPLGDGMVYRYTAGTGKSNPDSLVSGPQWKSEAAANCTITPLVNDFFLINDGSKKITRWQWPAGGGGSKVGEWELRAAPAGPGVLIPPLEGSNQQRLMIADASGIVWLYANDRGGQPVRAWRPGSEIPPGRPSSPLVLQRNTDGQPIVAYIVEERTIVWLDPEQEKPRMVSRGREEVEGTLIGGPQPLGGGQWSIVDLGGQVSLYDSNTAKLIGNTAIHAPGCIPATASVPLNKSTLLTPLSDGSAALLPKLAGEKAEAAAGKEEEKAPH